MKKILFSCVLVISLSSLKAQQFPVDTAKLNNAYRELSTLSNRPDRQRAFFDAFPSTWEEYYLTYRYSNEPGYDLSMYHQGVEHTKMLLSRVTRIQDPIYCTKLISIASKGKPQMEPAKTLQWVLRTIMWRRMKGMYNSLAKLDREQQMQFWEFYWYSPEPNKKVETDFYRLYKINHDIYPKEAEVMKEAYERFYKGTSPKP